MHRSRWDEWREPGRSYQVAMAARKVPPSRDGRRSVPAAIDPGQPEPIAIAIEWEEARRPGKARPVLVPLFPVGVLKPTSPCPHRDAIPAGSTLCCMVCHQSGMDDHPGLRETAGGAMQLKNWRPPEQGDPWSRDDVAPTAEPTRYRGPAAPETRRQRRAAARVA